MRKEISAGGLVVRRSEERWWLAVIRPQGKPVGVWALPKGHIETDEPAEAAARRETREETGLETEVVRTLGESRYVYTWDGERIAKVVVFFLLRPTGGELGDLPEGMQREVAEVAWIPLDEAEQRLAYSGERVVARRALDAVATIPSDAASG